MNVAKLYNDIYFDISGLKAPVSRKSRKGHDQYRNNMTGSSWGHGYATRVHTSTHSPGMYYTYIASYCFAEMIWKRFFQKNPMDKKEGMRYRRLVLEKGGSQDPMELLENYLGERLNVEDLCN